MKPIQAWQGPGDPDRGPPPRYLDKKNQSECGEPTTSKNTEKDDE